MIPVTSATLGILYSAISVVIPAPDLIVCDSGASIQSEGAGRDAFAAAASGSSAGRARRLAL